MLVFIDDSGDPGFKLDRGSTKFFIIAMVIFDDDLEAEKTAVNIKELRRSLGFPDDAEFRFFKTRHENRVKFLETIRPFNFRIRYLLVDKSKIRSALLKNNKNSFYAYFIKTALEHNGGTIRDAKIKIDGSGDRVFRNNFLTYLRRELNSGDHCVVRQCRLVDSRSNVLIQMADMVAGSLNRYHQNGDGGADYFSFVRKHIEDFWPFE